MPKATSYQELQTSLWRAAVRCARMGSNSQGKDPSTSDGLKRGPTPCAHCQTARVGDPSTPLAATLVASLGSWLLGLSRCLKQPGVGIRAPRGLRAHTFLEPLLHTYHRSPNCAPRVVRRLQALATRHAPWHVTRQTRLDIPAAKQSVEGASMNVAWVPTFRQFLMVSRRTWPIEVLYACNRRSRISGLKNIVRLLDVASVRGARRR